MVISFFIFFSNARAQTFLKDSKIWSVDQSDDDESNHRTLYYKFEGDTVIKSNHYTKTYYSYSKANWSPINMYLREDAGIVYFPAEASDKELILYDFNLKTGEFYYYPHLRQEGSNPLIVDSVVVKNELGIPLNHWYFSFAEWEGPTKTIAEIWIEGIGSLTDPLVPIGAHYVGEIKKLICVNEDSKQIYQNPSYSGCEAGTIGVSNVKRASNLIDVLNSENGVILVRLKNSKQGKLLLFRLDGIKIASIKIAAPSSSVCVPVNGILLYRFISSNGETQTGKVIVQ